MQEPQFFVKYIIVEEGEMPDSDNAEDLAWPAGAGLPECGEIFGIQDTPYQVYDRQWHYHHTHEGSHLHFTMILGEPTEDWDED